MGLPGDTRAGGRLWTQTGSGGFEAIAWPSRGLVTVGVKGDRGRRVIFLWSFPRSRLASELQALKQKLATVQSRLKASAAEPLRPDQQGTKGWSGSGWGVTGTEGADSYFGH